MIQYFRSPEELALEAHAEILRLVHG